MYAIVTGWDAAPAIILLSLSIPAILLGVGKEKNRGPSARSSTGTGSLAPTRRRHTRNIHAPRSPILTITTPEEATT